MRIKRLVGMVIAAMLVFGAFAPAAQADLGDTADIAVQGTATVGKNFKSEAPCTKQGLGEPQGKGLVLPSPVGNKAHGKTAVYRLQTTVVVASAAAPVPPTGVLNVCGYIAPTDQGLGAACGASRGHDGQGKLVVGDRTYKIYNLGWNNAVGGTLPVRGNYRKIVNGNKNQWLKTEGTITGVVQAVGSGCTENKCGDPKVCSDPTADGATSFTVVGDVVAAMPGNMAPPGSDKGAPIDKCGQQPTKEGC